MHALIERRRDEIAGLCRRFGVRRLEVFGSAARGEDFDPATSDADFQVSFDETHEGVSWKRLSDLGEALERLLGRPADLVTRGEVERSRNYIRKRRILADANQSMAKPSV